MTQLTKVGLLLLTATLTTRGLPDDSLGRGFANPPDSAKPWVMWFWISDFVTKEAITYDLEAYQRVGVGGVLLFPNYEHVEGWGFVFAPNSCGKDRRRTAPR